MFKDTLGMSSTGAFDWDQDFDALVHAPSRVHAVPVPTSAPPASPTRTASPDAPQAAPAKQRGSGAEAPLRSWIRSALPFVAGLAIGLGAAWLAQDQARLSATLHATAAAPAVTMPDGLVTYDQSRFDNFRAGIVGFSDSELRSYARRTLLDIRAMDNPMTASLLDALVLVRQEMDRRGLRTAADLPRVH